MKLKALSLSDLEQVRQWRNEQIKMLRTPFFLTQEQQVKFYHDIICNRQANARFWGIQEIITLDEAPVLPWLVGTKLRPAPYDFLIGMCGLENISWENRLAEISVIMSPSYQEGTEEALKLLLHEGFMSLNLDNIFAEVYECNPNFEFWIKIAKKYNCKIVFLPDRKYYNGEYHSSAYINFNKGARNDGTDNT